MRLCWICQGQLPKGARRYCGYECRKKAARISSAKWIKKQKEANPEMLLRKRREMRSQREKKEKKLEENLKHLEMDWEKPYCKPLHKNICPNFSGKLVRWKNN